MDTVFFLSAAGTDNVIFTTKDQKFFVSKNFLAKDLKDQFTEMNVKQKVRIKIRRINIDILSR